MADTSTNVIIKNKATDDPFKQIIAAIQRSQSSTRNTLDQLGEQQKKQNTSNIIASTARERKDRATNAALFGKVDKATSIVDDLKNMLKSALDKLTDMISDMAKNALRSYDETARQLKALHFSGEDRKKEMLRADKAQLLLQERGIIMQSSETHAVATQLANAGFDPRNLTTEMLATVAIGIKNGMDPVMAAQRAQEAKDQAKLQDAWVKAYNFTGNKTFLATNKLLDEHKAALMVHLERTGQQQEDFQLELAKNAKSMDKLLNGFVDPEDQAKMLEHVMLLNSKQIEKIDGNMISQLLGIAPEIYKNSNNKNELILQAMQEAIATGNTEMLNVLNQSVGGDSKIIEGIMSAARTAQANPEKFAERLKEIEEDDKANFNSNTEGGKLGAFVNSLMTKANVFTSKWFDGGIFGSAAVELNDLFGANMGVEDITKTGFTEVIKILKTAASNGWGTISAKLAAFKDSQFGKIFSTFLPGIFVKAFTGTSTLGWVLKGLRLIIPPLLPIITLVGTTALAGYTTFKFIDKINKKKEAKELKDEKRKIDNEVNDQQAFIDSLKEFNADPETIKNEEAKLANLKQKQASIQSKLDKVNNELTPDTVKQLKKASEQQDKLHAQALAEVERLNEDIEKAQLAGNEKAYKQLVEKRDKILADDLEANNKILQASKASTGFIAQTAELFGQTMSVDQLAAWQNFCDGFTNGISSIGTSISETLDDITDGISNISTSISETWDDFWNSWSFSDVLPSIDDIKADIKALWDKIDLSELLGINLPSLSGGGFLSSAGNWLSSIFNFQADGIVANKPTPSIIGEAGKEILLPLTRPDRMRELLSSLTSAEKSSIISAINASNQNNNSNNNTDLNVQTNSAVPGNDAATINKILSYSSNKAYVYDSIRYGRNRDGSLKSKDPEYGAKKREAWYQESLQNAQNREGYDLIKGTWAERALAWGAAQIGLPYLLRSIGKIGYVCNELTNAALLGSGFDLKDFRIHGVKTTFANISSGKMVSGKDRKGRMREYPAFRLRPDITPENAIPGMIFFQDSSKNKDGQFAPGHVGLVYYGHQRLHSAGGSGDYSGPDAFLNKYQTPCRGVTVNEFDKNARYQFGELPGLFEQASGDWEPPKNATVEFGPTDINKKPGEAILNEQNNLAESAKSSVTENTSKYQAADMQKYIKLVTNMMGTNNTKEILSFMEVMVKYLRDIANAPANKRPNMSPTRPVPNVY
jgi:hypothetical protein